MIGALAVLLMLSACGTDPEPSPTPEPTPPQAPAIVSENSEEGAEAFVRHYIAVSNYATVTGDTTELQQLTHSQCEGCSIIIEYIDEIYDAGGFVTDNSWVIGDIETEMTTSDVFISAEITTTSGKVKNATDAEIESIPAISEKELFFFTVQNSDQGWRVTQLGTETAE